MFWRIGEDKFDERISSPSYSVQTLTSELLNDGAKSSNLKSKPQSCNLQPQNHELRHQENVFAAAQLQSNLMKNEISAHSSPRSS